MKDISKVLTSDLNLVQKKVITLREAIEQYKLIIDSLMNSLNDGIIIIDKNQNISDINMRLEKQFEIIEKEYDGKSAQLLFNTLLSRFDENSAEKVKSLIDKTSESENFISETIKVSLMDGDDLKMALKVYTSPIYNDEIGYIGRIWRFEDITEEIKVDKMKTEFISIASHQLRTPLTAINGNIDMILDGDFGEISDDIKQPLTDMQTATKNLIELVNGLLDISRLEMGKIVPDLKDIDLVEKVKQITHLNQTLIDQKKIKLKFNSPDNLIFNTDEKIFAESATNLLSNAIKYTPTEGTIVVKLERQDSSVLFQVEDSGIGVPESSRDNLFSRFFRADNVLTENFEGTGLGLYYVKKSIESINGEVYYEPREQGSIFGFILN